MSAHSIIVVMGVSGSGKTTVGAMLAGRLHWKFADADDFHSPANVAKMAAGHPLTDADREPWLQAIAAWIDAQLIAEQPAVITCSALKRRYRDVLRRPQVRFVYLQGTKELISDRLASRAGHFFRSDMLNSQLADLEEPTPDENPLTISIAGAPEDMVTTIVARLHG